MTKSFLFATAISLLPQSSLAQSGAPLPWAPAADLRIQTIEYDPGTVVVLQGCRNFQTMITLADDEHVENVGLGDGASWQVTPNKRGNLLFVKATADKAFSNMTVVTDKRSYDFELRTATASECAHGQVIYNLRFHYAAPKPAGTVANPAKPADPNAFLPVPEKRNSAYTYSGAVELVPIRVFDDGISTYMKWPVGIMTPAVYALNTDNSESIVNYASRGDYFVIEQVSRAFVLRRGDQKTVLYNDSFLVQGLDDQSPKPRKGGR